MKLSHGFAVGQSIFPSICHSFFGFLTVPVWFPTGFMFATFFTFAMFGFLEELQIPQPRTQFWVRILLSRFGLQSVVFSILAHFLGVFFFSLSGFRFFVQV